MLKNKKLQALTGGRVGKHTRLCCPEITGAEESFLEGGWLAEILWLALLLAAILWLL